MPPRKKKITKEVIPAKVLDSEVTQTRGAGIQPAAIKWAKPTLIAFAFIVLAGASVGIYAQTARASEEAACTGLVSCVQSFTSGLWATITRTPPQKTTASAWERITSPSADAEYGTKHPFILQPKEGDFVGIGTDNPRAKLQINGGSADTLEKAGPGIYIDELESEVEDSARKLSFTYTPRVVLRGDGTAPYLDFSTQPNLKQYTARIQGKGQDLALDSKDGSVLLQSVHNGNVGIGTTTPNQKLVVNGGIGFYGTGINTSDKKLYSPADGVLEWMTNNAAKEHAFVLSDNGGRIISLNTDGSSFFMGGNVGIGTTTPGTKLHVVANGGGHIATEAADGSSWVEFWSGTGNGKTVNEGWRNPGLFFNSAQPYLQLGSATTKTGAATASMVLTNDGKVGIGTTDPTGKLTVKGSGTTAIDIGDKDAGNNYWSIAVQKDDSRNQNDLGNKLRIMPDNPPGEVTGGDPDAGITILRSPKSGTGRGYYFGNVGIDKSNPEFKLDVANGDINVAYFGSNLANANKKQKLALANDRIGLDVAEIYQTNEDVEVGDVLVTGDTNRVLKKSSKQYEADIIGVVSGAPALLFEGSELKLGSNPNRFTKGAKPPVALAGRVPVKVSLENGPIKVGDYLTSSLKSGVAMRATDPGMALGIALENYSGGGDGKVLTFINIGEKNVARKVKVLEKEIADLKKSLSK